MLRLIDDWVWDFWFAKDGDRTHVFYLHAPRSLGDPHLRHRNARFGHAVSTDLVAWEVLPDPLPPAPPGSFDDLATWTGSIMRDDAGTWNLLYAGLAQSDDGLVQRIGLATSNDLLHWERFGDRPLIEADPRWYELLDRDILPEQAWRDPWIVRDPSGNYHALITARARSGDPDGRGVIGHAVSTNLRHWEVLPPFASPAGFSQLEVTETVEIDARCYLVFCTSREHVSAGRRSVLDQPPRTGTYICRVPTTLGPFDVAETTAFEPYSDRYAGKLVEGGGDWYFMGFIDEVDGVFVGVLDDPVRFDPGLVTVVADAAVGLPAW